jgi:peptidoglycan/LPS O-acetylase OafA/YrhL
MSKSFNYRPDIDGLRAIAVLLVIFYHAGFSAISGGFIGVDIFFVLSGFLITLILDKEMSTGVFSFKSFYLRRIRRLLPALLFVLCVTTITAFYYLVP